MDYKTELNNLYSRVITPLEDYSDKNSNTITGMLEYMTVFGEVMNDFARQMNDKHREVLTKDYSLKKGVEKYITDLKNKLVDTYKPR